jgi:hypothetical protein
MIIIPKKIINKYQKIQEDTFEKLQEKGFEHKKIIEMRNATKIRDEIKLLDERLRTLNNTIIELSAKSSVLRQFLHEIKLYSKKII